MVTLLSILGSAALLATALPATPSAAQLGGLTPQQALAQANQWRGAGGLQSYVTSAAVVFKFPDGKQRSVVLPTKQMVVAIAPYVNQTHPCKTHFMSGCQGELVKKSINVVVKNQAGKTVMNKTMKTLPNGFLELWLDRNQTYRVSLKMGEKTTTGVLTTHADSDTCITTLRLQ
ncbi:exported protein [Deinococcus marmoris]|uniref:Exported protein n=1 Tax=Deinococcus marmoris TaxID=249408 RepID=A0A1U7P046_9DEIO|nr:exported protein [Deinococcus marmoris]